MPTYFISGHINLTQVEFDTHYVPKINQVLNSNNKFVMGNAQGGDTLSLDYLISKKVNPKSITIYYHGYDKNHPRNKDYYTNLGVNLIDGFRSYTHRDSAMTYTSDVDIAWVRPPEETKKLLESLGEVYRASRISGTEKNLIRRQKKL
jgi:hypothetical protein